MCLFNELVISKILKCHILTVLTETTLQQQQNLANNTLKRIQKQTKQDSYDIHVYNKT